jgi:hypothetical protein
MTILIEIQPANPGLARCVVLGMIFFGVTLDLFLAWRGWATITSQVRAVNETTDQLINLGWFALWLHFFAVPLLQKIWAHYLSH